MKNHYKHIAIIDDDVEQIKKITNSPDAHKVKSINDDPLILKTINKMNRIVDKDEHGVVQQGVFIGTPIMAGGTIIMKKTMIGTDSATYLPSTNATE
jgi:hypothetical protein